MGEKKKKPIHKRWWFWVIAIIVVGSWIVGNDDKEPASSDKEKVETVDKKADAKNEDKEENEEKLQEKKIKIDEELEVNGAYIKLQSLVIKDNRASLYAYWNNHTLYEAHLDYLAPLEIYQNDELVEFDRDKLTRRVKPGVDGSLDLDLELINHEDEVTFRFYGEDDSKEEITVKLD